jgi:hypothetical protein
MLTVYGTFDGFGIVQQDGTRVKGYPYGIDYPKVKDKTGWFQLRDAQSSNPDYVSTHLVIINYILD